MSGMRQGKLYTIPLANTGRYNKRHTRRLWGPIAKAIGAKSLPRGGSFKCHRAAHAVPHGMFDAIQAAFFFHSLFIHRPCLLH